jgi:hypothetical protein
MDSYVREAFTIKEKEKKEAPEDEKLTPSITVTVPDTTIGTDYNPIVSTDSDGQVVVEYKPEASGNEAYSTEKPTAAGIFTVRATVKETEKYYSATCTATFTISKKKVTVMSITVNDIYVDQEVSPVLTTDSDGKKDASFRL